MDNYFGSIDLTKVGIIARQHPELIKEVQFKDGTKHKLLGISISPRNREDSYGNVAYVKASVRRSDERQGINYFLGDLKVSDFSKGNHQSSPSSPAVQHTDGPGVEEEYPF